MATRRIPRIRRIAVAIDASKHSLAALEAAVDLAKRLDARLTGLFVEDINLLRLGSLPVSNQVGGYSLRKQALSEADIRRQLKAQSRWAYEALELLSQQQGLEWSFEVARGSILVKLIQAAEKADLIILGKTGWSDTRLVGSAAQGVLSQQGNLTLILRDGVRLGKSLMIVYDRSEVSRRALDVAGQFASVERGRLVVMLVAEDRQAADKLEAEISKWNERQGYEIVFLWTPDTHPLIICSIARTEGSGLLVIPQGKVLLSDDALKMVLNDIDCPVLFVGQNRETTAP